jgi:hypothetical protein
MNRPGKCLNAFHLAYSKRMRRAATRRSKQPPMSPGEFTQQVLRLRQGRLRSPSAA